MLSRENKPVKFVVHINKIAEMSAKTFFQENVFLPLKSCTCNTLSTNINYKLTVALRFLAVLQIKCN